MYISLLLLLIDISMEEEGNFLTDLILTLLLVLLALLVTFGRLLVLLGYVKVICLLDAKVACLLDSVIVGSCVAIKLVLEEWGTIVVGLGEDFDFTIEGLEGFFCLVGLLGWRCYTYALEEF